MASFMWSLCVSLELIFLFFSCNSFTLPGISERSKWSREMSIMPNPVPLMQCYFNGTYYEGDIPSTGSCRSYYSCAPSGTTIPNATGQLHMDCPIGHNGRLTYDFMSCSCLSVEDAVCFNASNPEHSQNFYRCTQPYVPWTGQKISEF